MLAHDPHRFRVRLAKESRLDEVTALSRSAALAAQLAHARWLAADQPPTIDGPRGVVAMTYGYPSTATLPLMLAEAETASFVYSGGVWRHRDSVCSTWSTS